jgi:hypothetical protein
MPPTRQSSRRTFLTGAALLAVPLAAAPLLGARATTPGRHPSYLHALTDLRSARWLLLHRPDNPHAQEAVRHIELAIVDIKAAAWEDGRDLNYHPPIDVPPDWNGTLHRSLELLRGVRHDVALPEDDPAGLDLQHRSLEHVDLAIRHVRFAMGGA